MNSTTSLVTGMARRAVREGALAALLSGGSLALRGKADSGSAVAPVNAPAHVVWGDESLRRNDASVRHTAVGAALHAASAVLWAGLFEVLQARRAKRTVANALVDAAATAAVAAVVDFKVVPKRFTPGFEHRLTKRSLWMVYGSMALGMAVGALRNRQR